MLAMSLLKCLIHALMLPTPTSEPCDEVVQLRTALRADRQLSISNLAQKQEWPETGALLRALKWANFVAIPGGNFPDYMSLVAGQVGEALKRKFLSGKAVFVGASNGTVSWFDQVHTADKPSTEGGGTNAEYRLEPGLGVLPGFVCAHYNERNEHSGLARATLFQDMMKLQPVGSVGFGIDTQAALVLDKGKLSCVTRDRYAHIQIIRTLPNREIEIVRLTESKGELTLEEVYGL